MDETILKSRSRVHALFPELAAFGPDDFARIGTTRPVIMIAMTARTGSTFLMGGLSQALKLGNPADMTEIFNCRDILPWYKNERNLKTFAEVLRNYYSQCDHHIVFKTNWQDFAFFEDHIDQMFPNLEMLYLDRINIEAQAVSVVMAMASSLWHTADEADVQRRNDLPENMRPKFDMVTICRTIDMIANEKKQWETFFFESGREPVRLIYEGFSDNLQLGVDRVAAAIGVEASSLPRVQPHFKQLSDSVNDDWVKRVKNYRSGAFYEKTLLARDGGPKTGRKAQNRIFGL